MLGPRTSDFHDVITTLYVSSRIQPEDDIKAKISCRSKFSNDSMTMSAVVLKRPVSGSQGARLVLDVIRTGHKPKWITCQVRNLVTDERKLDNDGKLSPLRPYHISLTI